MQITCSKDVILSAKLIWVPLSASKLYEGKAGSQFFGSSFSSSSLESFLCKANRRPNVRIPEKSHDYEEKRDCVFTYPGTNFNQSNINTQRQRENTKQR